MPAAAVVTIIAAAIAVLAVAFFLLTIARSLRNVSASLDRVIDVVGQIPERTAPIEQVLGAINKDLAGGQAFLESLLAGAPPPRAARPTRSAPPAEPVAPAAAVATPSAEPEHVPLPRRPKLLPP